MIYVIWTLESITAASMEKNQNIKPDKEKEVNN